MAIEVKGLSKCYGSKTVFDNFNMTFREGQITCIMGNSGCGKTERC